MPFAFALVVGLAALFYAVLARWRPLWVGPSGGIIIGTMFVAAWFRARRAPTMEFPASGRNHG